jgi:excisionase family DNA binding protein
MSQATITEGDLLTPAEVAKIMRVSKSTVYRWVEEGTLPAMRLGGVVRIYADALVKDPVSE